MRIDWSGVTGGGGFMDENLPSWGATRPEPTAETHTAQAQKIDRCVYCGVAVTSFQCKCGYWCSECWECSRKNTEWMRRHIIQKHAESVMDRIDAEVLERYSKEGK